MFEMIKTADYIEKRYRSYDIGKLDLEPGDIITSPRNHLMGIMLEKDFIAVDVKHFFSFRFKLQNIGYLRNIKIARSPIPIDVHFLEDYFFQNNDNPYSVQHVMNCIFNMNTIEHLTQFPPLYVKKDETHQRDAIEKMMSKAMIGDSVYSYDRNSGISRLIRKIDKGPWSHVGKVDGDKNIVEMTTSGIAKSTFSSLAIPSLDVGLYRLRDRVLDDAEQERIQKFLDTALMNQIKFNWRGIFIVFLNKKVGLPFKHLPTPADLIYSNNYELIAYA